MILLLLTDISQFWDAKHESIRFPLVNDPDDVRNLLRDLGLNS